MCGEACAAHGVCEPCPIRVPAIALALPACVPLRCPLIAAGDCAGLARAVADAQRCRRRVDDDAAAP